MAGIAVLVFVVAGMVVFGGAMADDLASGYVGCRVLASGHPEALYSYDPVNFAGLAEGATVWPREAAKGRYTGYLHPYVQTPLWAWGLRPLCEGMAFAGFKRLFLLLALGSLAGCVWLTARYWTPVLFGPVAFAVILGVLFFSEPFLYAMGLVQTHALILLLAVAGLALAQRERPVWAGLCVALATAVKITPGVLLVYWIAGRRWRAAVSLAVWSVGLLALTRVVVGAPLFHEYVASMRRTSQVLLVSENNQSLAAWWMGRFFSPDEVFDVNAFALSAGVKLISMGLMVVSAAAGGWMDRVPLRREAKVPLGLGVALVAMTVFAPIAWTHYFVVLVLPLMLLAQVVWELRGRVAVWGLAGTIGVSVALLYRPLAPDVVRMDLSDFAVLRGVFFAGVVVLVALGAAWLVRAAGTANATGSEGAK